MLSSVLTSLIISKGGVFFLIPEIFSVTLAG
jgi:hypothetical protein